MRIAAIVVLLMSLGPAALGQWTAQPSGTTARLRGVSARGEGVAWASGARGTCLRTVDDGATWTPVVVPDAAGLDFRDVHAFDSKAAVLLSIGPGALSRVYRTDDGGATWTIPYTMRDPAGFLDAIAFSDPDHGLALGDPIEGRFTLLRTADGGRTWGRVPPANLPPALPGEGAFAASGTCLTMLGDGRHAWFATGGATVARVFRSDDGGLSWTVAPTPIRAGIASAGIFSLAFRDPMHGVAVGGDYKAIDDPSANFATTADGGRNWTLVERSRPSGFRSAVAYFPGTSPPSLVAVGPAGSDLSIDDGLIWRPLDGPGFHALAFGPRPGPGWAVGEDGRIARYNLRIGDPPGR